MSVEYSCKFCLKSIKHSTGPGFGSEIDDATWWIDDYGLYCCLNEKKVYVQAHRPLQSQLQDALDNILTFCG